MYQLNLICIFSVHTSDFIMPTCVYIFHSLFTFFSFSGIFQNQSVLIIFHNALEYSRYFSNMGKCLSSCICSLSVCQNPGPRPLKSIPRGWPQLEVQIVSRRVFQPFLRAFLWATQTSSARWSFMKQCCA